MARRPVDSIVEAAPMKAAGVETEAGGAVPTDEAGETAEGAGVPANGADVPAKRAGVPAKRAGAAVAREEKVTAETGTDAAATAAGTKTVDSTPLLVVSTLETGA